MAEKKKKEPYDQKTANLTPEEQAMRKENLEARKNMQDDAARNLCAAICLNSVHEYRVILRRIKAFGLRRMNYSAPITAKKKRGRPSLVSKKDEEMLEKLMEDKKDLEEFFDSDMFVTFTGVSGKEEAIRKIKCIPDGYEHLLERRMMA